MKIEKELKNYLKVSKLRLETLINDTNQEENKIKYDNLNKQLSIINDIIDICERRGRY